MSSLQSIFYSGHHAKVLSQTVDAVSWSGSEKDFPIVVGSLCFMGRVNEAQRLFNSREDSLMPADRVAARFYLAMGYTRLSEYPKGAKLFAANVRTAKNSKDKKVQYYSYQGLAFFRYYSGRFHLSLKWAEKSFSYASSEQFIYGKILSIDMMAHSLIHLGEVSKGMRLLNQAQKLSKGLHAKGTSQTIEISKATYMFRFGIDKPKLSKLKTLVKSYSNDNYSQTKLLLESARFCCLQGDLEQANNLLDQACPIIYRSDNRRQEVSLNLRYAYINYLQGDFTYALNLLKNARRLIHHKIDTHLEMELLGLEIKVLTALKYNLETKEKQKKLEQLTSITREHVNNNIQKREYGKLEKAPRKGEDPIGDLKNLIEIDAESSYQKIIESGYLGLLRTPLKVDPLSTQLYIDLIENTIIVFKRGSVHLHKNITPQNKKLAVLLQGRSLSKLELFEKNWGLNYDPERHSAVVLAGITQLRKNLGSDRDLLIFDESGYRLDATVHIHHSKVSEKNPSEAENSVQIKSQSINILNVPENLNWRQIKIINLTNKSDFYDVKKWIKLFKISKITASRDLSQLVDLGYFRRVGKGRATKYIFLNLTEESN